MAALPEPEPQELGRAVESPDYQEQVPAEHWAELNVLELCDGLDSPELPEPISAPSSPNEGTNADDWIVDLVASMEPTRAEIIRGVPVHCALQGCGQAMRGRQRGLYRLSRATTCIDEFWSHSWHTSAWMKYVTVWFLNSATIAAAFGMGGALLGFMLRAAGVLPVTLEGPTFSDSQWSVLSGLIFFCASFTLWRVRRLVFLDILCINQEDEGLKGEAMISMGAILKSSASMLVLWDPTWVQRLGSLQVDRLRFVSSNKPACNSEEVQKLAKEILVCFRAGLVSSQPNKTRSNNKQASEHPTKPYGTSSSGRKGWLDWFTPRMATHVTSIRQ